MLHHGDRNSFNCEEINSEESGEAVALAKQATDETPNIGRLSLMEKEKALSERYLDERGMAIEKVLSWTEQDQTDFVKALLQRMSHNQHGQIDLFLKPMLQRDFITLLPTGLAVCILSLLDARSLAASAMVNRSWRRAIANGMLWRKLIECKVRCDPMWKGLSEKRSWKQFLFTSKEQATYLIALANGCAKAEAEELKHSHPDPLEFQHLFYRKLYPQIVSDIETIENNWRTGKHLLQRINCESENSKGVYCLQYDDEKIISGLRDNTIKIWRRGDLSRIDTLTGHTGSVLCLQYDERIIASGSSDATVRIWDVNTGAQLNTLIHHCEAVLHLRFQNGLLVTCSKDRSIAVWDLHSPKEIDLRRVLVGHRAAVNVVDFDSTYIVSASGDRTIKVWSVDTCEFVRTLNGHKRGIACLQYRDRLIVSGSSDFSIRLWNIECGTCLRVLDGHEELVRCIRFDNKRIVSGAYDGKIKVWDLQAALDNRVPINNICIKTLSEHTGRVFRLQFDEFQIVSSSHDDTILIWDFLNAGSATTSTANNGQTPQPAPQQPQPLPPAFPPPGAHLHHHHHHHNNQMQPPPPPRPVPYRFAQPTQQVERAGMNPPLGSSPPLPNRQALAASGSLCQQHRLHKCSRHVEGAISLPGPGDIAGPSNSSLLSPQAISGAQDELGDILMEGDEGKMQEGSSEAAKQRSEEPMEPLLLLDGNQEDEANE